MDPRVAGADSWVLMTQTLNSLVLFVVLAINTALCMMVAHGVIPSLIDSGDAPVEFSRFRQILYVIFGVSLVVALYALYRWIALALLLVNYVFPRLTI